MKPDWKYPAVNEYAPYYEKYIKLVPEGDVTAFLEQQLNELTGFILSIPESKKNYRYAENKWTIPQIIQHLIDGERIFSYRALRFARKDTTPLPGFEENDYAEVATAEGRDFDDLLAEFSAVRKSTIALFKTFDEETLNRTGTANNNKISVRALAYVVGGHVRHHMQVVRERYLNDITVSGN